MRKRNNTRSLFVAAVLLAGICACHEKKPAEKAGEKIDEGLSKAAEKIGEGLNEAGDAIQDAGEEMEDAVKDR